MIDSSTELGIKGQIQSKESKKTGDFMMRFADDGMPATLYGENKSKEWIRDSRTGMRRQGGEEIAVTPRFFEIPEPGSVLELGIGQTFQIVEPKPHIIKSSGPDSVYVKRIPLEDTVGENGVTIKGYRTLAKELEDAGKKDMVLSLFDAPLTDNTTQEMNRLTR